MCFEYASEDLYISSSTLLRRSIDMKQMILSDF